MLLAIAQVEAVRGDAGAQALAQPQLPVARLIETAGGRVRAGARRDSGGKPQDPTGGRPRRRHGAPAPPLQDPAGLLTPCHVG